jgi:hypothetical protein
MYKMLGQYSVCPNRSIDQLCRWAQDNGAYWKKVKVGVICEGGCVGVVATEDIGPNEEFMAIPNALLFTYKLACQSELSQVFAEHPLEARDTEEVVFAVYLLLEKGKGEGSFWYPFIKSLPEKIENLEDWEDREAAELQDAELAYDAKHRFTIRLRHYMHAKRILKLYPHIFPEGLEFKQFVWAHRAISTRCFGSFTPYTCLAPIAELMNHSNVDMAYYYGEDDQVPPGEINSDEDSVFYEARSYTQLRFEQALDLIHVDASLKETLVREARFIDEQSERETLDSSNIEEIPDAYLKFKTGDQEYVRGSQVYVPYGRYSNRLLLSHYGFCMSSNKYNYAFVYVNLSQLTQTAELTEVLQFKVTSRFICKDLVNILRVFLWSNDRDGITACFSQTSLDLEQRVVEWCLRILADALGKYPTSLEQDQEALSQPQSAKLQLAVKGT